MENNSKKDFADLLEMHAIVRGKVQGIGFRAATRHYARELGLKGTVRNLVDGTVEIYAYGTKDQLEELMERLHQEMREIKETSIEYLPEGHSYEDFRIIY